MKFLCFLSDGRWEHNVQRAAQDSFWNRDRLQSHGWDAAVGANRPELYPAPSTDSRRNFSSGQLSLSSSASSFCGEAPGDICPLFIKHVEIYRLKTSQKHEAWLIKVPISLKASRRKPPGRCLWKQTVMCAVRAKPWFSSRVVPRVHVYEQPWLGTVSWTGTQKKRSC